MSDPRSSEQSPNRTAPPDLTTAYHKARHFLALLSGILLTWELLGLGFGEADPGLMGIRIRIAQPDAIPVAILLLMIYAAFRLGVEWWQCDPKRRDTTASIVDLVAAYALFIFAVTIFGLQRLTAFRLADLSLLLTAVGVVGGVVVALPVMLLFKRLQSKEKWTDAVRRDATRLLWTILSGAGIAALVGTVVGLWLHFGPSVTLGLAIGSALCGMVGAFAARLDAERTTAGRVVRRLFGATQHLTDGPSSPRPVSSP